MLKMMTQISTQASKKYSKLFNKFLLKYQVMLLLESSIKEDTPYKFNEIAMEFFQNSSSLNVQISLSSIFVENKLRFSVPPFLETLFLHDNFM